MTVTEMVERERRRVSRAYVGAAACFAAAASLAAVALGAWALGDARWIALPRVTPFAVWLAVAAAVAAAALWSRRRARRDAALPQVAAAIEREQSLRAGMLRGALEVAESGALGRRAAEQMGERLRRNASVLAPTLLRSARGLARRGVAAAAVAAAALLLVGFAFGDGLAAILRPVRAWQGTLIEPLRFRDVPRVVLRGEKVRVTLEAPDRRAVTLAQRVTGQEWRVLTLTVARGPGSTELAQTVVGPLDADLTLVASDGRSASDTMTIRVTDRPFVGDVALLATYPAYLKRAAEPLAAGEVVRVPRGTVVSVDGRASTALSAVMLASGRDTLRLTPDGRRFGGHLVAIESGRWTWSAAGANGAIADLPAPVELEVVPDSAPRVEIVSPAHDTTIGSAERVALTVSASDDHGIGSVVLRSWRQPAAAGAQPTATQRIAAEPATQWSGAVDVDAAERGLEPGDELHVLAVATDESPWRQSGASRELVLRVPTLARQRALARSAADSTVARAAAAASAQRQLQQRTGEAARSRGERRADDRPAKTSGQERSASSLSYESAERAQALVKEQRDLAGRVQALQQAAKALERQLREAGALDSGLAAKLQEAQKLLAEALTPELAEQMRKIEEAAQKLSGDEERQALGNLAEQQQRLREQLDRSVEMLKRAALEGAMQTLRDEAREIASQEHALAEPAGKSGDAQPPKDDATALAERSRELSRDVADLAKRLDKEKAETGARKANAAAQHADASSKQMQRASAAQAREQRGDQSSRDGTQRSSDAAEEAANEMEQAAGQLADARQSQINEWKQELTGELDRSIQEMLQLAREQQSLEQRARQGESAGSMSGEQSAVQQGVEKAGQRLQKEGQKTSLLSQRSQRAVGSARQKVSEATQEVSQESQGSQSGSQGGTRAAGAMQEAAAALNQAAAALVRDRERANSASSASGLPEMLQQLQELAKQQGGLNSQAQGLVGPKGQGASGAQAREGARQLARQQRSVAEQLEQVGEADATGRADELAKEAREIAQALDRGALDQTVLDRQQRLFRRMLDAGQSMEKDEREDTGKREAQSATRSETFTPTDGDAEGRAAARFRAPTWNELRGLSAEERRLVLEYFKRLNATP